MKKYNFSSLIIYCCFIFSSCTTATPEKYFNVAILNSNVVIGFANSSLSRELEMPSMKMMGSTDEPMAYTRTEIIEDKIKFCKKILTDLKDLNETPDASDILSTSIAMYEFVINVYETDYMTLAKLYDEGAEKHKIIAFDNALKAKHASMFELHYENLIRSGKQYAARHNIKVNWAI